METTTNRETDPPDEQARLERAAAGDQAAWAAILAPHRDRLRRMVALRLDHRLKGRIYPSDVLQEAFLQAAQEGRVRQGTLKQRGITPPTTIRLAQEDISRARTLAERRGLRYQTYLKMLIHEALEREERQAS